MTRQVWINELRHLMPGIRANFLMGRQKYDDQQGRVMVEEDNARKSQVDRMTLVQMRGFGVSPAMMRNLGIDEGDFE